MLIFRKDHEIETKFFIMDSTHMVSEEKYIEGINSALTHIEEIHEVVEEHGERIEEHGQRLDEESEEKTTLTMKFHQDGKKQTIIVDGLN